MSAKRKRVYEVLLDGATAVLSGKLLYDYVIDRCAQRRARRSSPRACWQ